MLFGGARSVTVEHYWSIDCDWFGCEVGMFHYVGYVWWCSGLWRTVVMMVVVVVVMVIDGDWGWVGNWLGSGRPKFGSWWSRILMKRILMVLSLSHFCCRAFAEFSSLGQRRNNSSSSSRSNLYKNAIVLRFLFWLFWPTVEERERIYSFKDKEIERDREQRRFWSDNTHRQSTNLWIFPHCDTSVLQSHTPKKLVRNKGVK